MKIVINPKFTCLSEYIQNIPKHEYKYDVLNDSRNLIHKVTVNGMQLVIKKYKRPTILNCFIYSYFRKNKARRAYEYALKLEELGFNTAEPIAYIEIKKNGFFHTGYFISSFLPYPVLDEARINFNEVQQKLIIKDLAAFTVELHEKGVGHYDYNNGNILFYKNENESQYQFALIDINRMYFGHLSTSRCVRLVKTLFFSLPVYSYFIDLYTKQRGINTELFFARVLLKRSLMINTRIKRFFKRLVGLKD